MASLLLPLRADRMKSCPLPAGKDLKKDGRGSFAFRTDAKSSLVITKWYNNKCVQICLTSCDPESVENAKRWDRKFKKYIEIRCPTVIKDYNRSIGDVDLSDMLISFHRTNFKTKRWYMKVLFHSVDICKVNAWF